jgi:hypothetical protein
MPITTITIAGTAMKGSITTSVVENHSAPHRDYRHLSKEDQKRYWDWRHNHDHDHDRDHR